MIAAALSKPSTNEDSASDNDADADADDEEEQDQDYQDEEGLRSSQEEDATRSTLKWGCDTAGEAPDTPPSSPASVSEFGMVLVDVSKLPVATHVPDVEVADACCSPMATVFLPAIGVADVPPAIVSALSVITTAVGGVPPLTTGSSVFPFPGLITAERTTPGPLSDLPPLGAGRKFVMPAFKPNLRFAVGCRLRRKPRFSRAGFIQVVNWIAKQYLEGFDTGCDHRYYLEHGEGFIDIMVSEEQMKYLEGTYYEGVQARRIVTILYSYEHLKVALRELPERNEARVISWHAAEYLLYPRTMTTGYYVNLRECLMPRSSLDDAYVYGWECEAYDGLDWLYPEPMHPEIVGNSFCSAGNRRRWSRVAPVSVARFEAGERVADEEFKAEMVRYVATTKANNAAKLARAMAASKARAAEEADAALIASMD